MEKVTPSSGAARESSQFKEDTSIPGRFRAHLKDYAQSGYDRGHLGTFHSHTHTHTRIHTSTRTHTAFYMSAFLPHSFSLLLQPLLRTPAIRKRLWMRRSISPTSAHRSERVSTATTGPASRSLSLSLTFFLSLSLFLSLFSHPFSFSHTQAFVRHLAKKYACVYVITGPVYLPKRGSDGFFYVKYRVLGDPPTLAVPTHFFKTVSSLFLEYF